MRKLYILAFLIFSIQISIERKLKAAGTRPDQFGMIHEFLQRATTGKSFDVRWSFLRMSCFFQKCQSSGIAVSSVTQLAKPALCSLQ